MPGSLIARFGVRNYSVAGIMGDVPIALDSLRPVREYVSMSSTSVVVAVTIPVGATGVVISVAGNAPITLPLVPIGNSDVFAASLTFRDVSPYTVALVDEFGEVVRVLTP